MNKKIMLMSTILIVAILVSGCRLAKEEGLLVESDRMIGVFVTTEYLDLYDFDSYFEDNISKFINGGNISITDTDNGWNRLGSDQSYQGRVYAELQKSPPYISEADGKTSYLWDYVFPDLDGIPFFTAEISPPDDEGYITTFNGGAICDIRQKSGDEATLEGTLYLALDSIGTVYVNPVYRSSDGRVFVTSGDGYSASGHDAEGQVFTTTLAQTDELTENGETIIRRFEVTLHIAVKGRPENVRIIQMDAQNIPVTSNEYDADSLPERITAKAETEYIILETESARQGGDTYSSRELIQTDEYYIICYTARPDGIIEPRPIELAWE